MGLLHDTMKFMKNNLHSKMSFISHVAQIILYLISNDPNISNLLTDTTKNMCSIFNGFMLKP